MTIQVYIPDKYAPLIQKAKEQAEAMDLSESKLFMELILSALSHYFPAEVEKIQGEQYEPKHIRTPQG